ncbi:hypothetical protein EVAR_4396_1 [Eumeta japonica]|uniref:Uncharacterized protein n=1 Tax=Eumeta variegata TaxID=151549 RepID=A0A4C1SYE6_EUMVA|nr:hypothetical protein EVAR_4396_1 [Eumeta japonica]
MKQPQRSNTDKVCVELLRNKVLTVRFTRHICRSAVTPLGGAGHLPKYPERGTEPRRTRRAARRARSARGISERNDATEKDRTAIGCLGVSTNYPPADSPTWTQNVFLLYKDLVVNSNFVPDLDSPWLVLNIDPISGPRFCSPRFDSDTATGHGSHLYEAGTNASSKFGLSKDHARAGAPSAATPAATRAQTKQFGNKATNID